MRQSEYKILHIVLAVIILAVVCIGGVELAVCSIAAPELYQELTEPVIAFVNTKRNELMQLNQTIFEQISLAAENVSQQTANIAAAVEEAQLPPAEDDPPLPPAPLAGDPDITSLIKVDGQFYLTSGTENAENTQTIYFNQKDEPWASQYYGTDDIAGYGCGPTSLAIAVSTLRGSIVDPAEMAQFCADSGYWAKRQGSYLSIVVGVADSYSLTCTSISPSEIDEELFKMQLSTGSMAIALMRKGHFTTSGHFIVLRGVTADGMILVSDPASLERSLTPWDLDLILDELSYSRSAGSPLWLLSYAPPTE